jgi:adenosine deaminase
VSGDAHPLGTYLADRVPIVLGTDDPGVSRSNMTREYLRAATDQSLDYGQLKTMARGSIEHSFLPPAERAVMLEDLATRFASFERQF